jgi:hypothetical protein
MATNRERDENGYLTIKGCPISSFGIFPYSAGQLGLDGDPNQIINVYRPESAVSDPEALESFKNMPFINEHTYLSGIPGDENAVAPEEKGVDGIITSNVYYDVPWMRGDLVIYSRKMQEELESGKKDLSLGYKCQFEHAPGTFDGQPYEFVQTKMRGNHIALVGEGRVPGARVLDGLCFDHLSFNEVPSENGANMKRVKVGKAADSAVEKLKALLPELAQWLSEESTEPAHQDGSGAVEGGEGNMAATANPASEGGTTNAEPTEGSSDGDLAALIAKVESALAELKQAANGGNAGEVGADGESSMDNEEITEQPKGADDAEMSEDAVEGLQSGETQPITEDSEGATEVVKASAGPTSGKNASASDAAISRFYHDLARKTSLYDRVSKVVGTFDHSAMDSRSVAVYGVKKLGIKCKAGEEFAALDGYLTGFEKAQVVKVQKLQEKKAQDAKGTEVDAYLASLK